MNKQEEIAIVLCFDKKDKVSYRELKMKFSTMQILQALTDITKHEPIIEMLIDENACYFLNGSRISIRLGNKGENFRDSDSFRLTDYGENLKYDYKNEKRLFYTALASAIIGGIGIIIGLLQLIF